MTEKQSLKVVLNEITSNHDLSVFPVNLSDEQLLAFLSYSIESAADEVFWMRSDSEIFYANNAACEKLGYELDELIGMRVWEWDPLFPKEVWPNFFSELRTKKHIQFETLHQHKNGHVFPVNIRGFYLHCDGEDILIAFVHDISKEKAQEATDRDNLLANLTAISVNCMSVTDSRYRVLCINEGYQELFGFSDDEFKGKIQQDSIFGPESDSAVIKRIGEALESKKNVFEELILYRKDGSTFWASLTIAPVIQRGKISNFVYIINNIDKIKISNKELQAANRKLSLITEGSQDGFWHWVDVKDSIVEWSGRTYTLFGYQPQEFESSIENYQAMIHPGDVSKIQSAINDAIQSKKSYEIQYRVKKKNGEYSWFRDRGKPFHDQAGNLIEMAGSVSNIDEIMRYQDSLNEANLKLSEAIKSGRIGIWDWNIVEDKLYWDDLMYEIYGVTKHANDSVATWENALHPEDKNIAQNALEEALQGIKNYSLEFRIIKPSGEVRHIKGDGRVMRDESGRTLRMLGTNIDITEQKRLEGELRQSQKMEAMGQLTGGIAHDFNNRLASIMGFTELLGEHLGDSPLRRYTDKIISAVEASSSLTNQLLTFSRKNQLTIETLDVHLVISEALEILSHSIDKKIELNFDLTAEKHTIKADKSLFQNAILNLCLNARDAMPDGGVLTLSTENRQTNKKDSFILIRCKDTGIGIAESEQIKIFEPFYTTKDVGAGTGLGLASVYSTISQFDGDISVESDVGVGACFEIVLPIFDDVSFTSHQAVALNESASITTQCQTVLVAEDEEALRELCTEYLDVLGHKGIFVSNGLEAVEVYQKQWKSIDLILIDMMMPLMNGKDAFHAIREINPLAKVIIVTGYSGEHTKSDLLASGVKAVLAKPYKLTDLKEIIQTFSD